MKTLLPNNHVIVSPRPDVPHAREPQTDSNKRTTMKKCIIFAFLLLCLSFDNIAQDAEPTFVEYRIKDLGTVLIPVSMELQSGSYKELSEKYSKEMLEKYGYEVSGDQVIFQQKGLNELKGFHSYARVMIATDHGAAGDYDKLTTRIKATSAELRELETAIKNQLITDLRSENIEILRWDGVSIVTVNGRSSVRVAYLRQYATNPPVFVQMFMFQNSDRMHRLTISYRVADEQLWKSALERTKNSFTITNIR